MDKLLEEKEINLRTLFEAGVHFGHPTRKWNPKMDSFIFTKKSKFQKPFSLNIFEIGSLLILLLKLVDL